MFTRVDGSPAPRLLTAVSAAVLMQDHGDTTRIAVRTFLESADLQAQPRLKARLHRVLTQTEHTQRYRWRALRELNTCIQLKRGSEPHELSDDLVWKGYEYFSLTKRPDREHPLRWALAPLWGVIGLYWMRRGLRAAANMEERERRQLYAVVAYYRVDVLHGLIESCLMLGRTARWLLAPAYRLVARAYRRVESRHPELMGHGYYWLRHLEARALARTLRDSEENDVDARLLEIETSCACLKNNVQMANAFLYRALVAEALGKGPEKITEHLTRAERELAVDSRDVATAVARLKLYQRILLPRTSRPRQADPGRNRRT